MTEASNKKETPQEPATENWRDEAKIKAGETGRSAVQIAWLATIIYPVSVVVLSIAGGIGSYYGAAVYVGTFLSVLASIAGVAIGAVAGFFVAGAIISGMASDLVFDAGWEASKIGLKHLRRKKSK